VGEHGAIGPADFEIAPHHLGIGIRGGALEVLRDRLRRWIAPVFQRP
jgi:hypothetical protein